MKLKSSQSATAYTAMRSRLVVQGENGLEGFSQHWPLAEDFKYMHTVLCVANYFFLYVRVWTGVGNLQTEGVLYNTGHNFS